VEDDNEQICRYASWVAYLFSFVLNVEVCDATKVL